MAKMCDYIANMTSINDIKGKKYGRLTALEPIGKNCGGKALWRFQCDCGTIIELPKNAVVSGNTNSCGCLKKSVAKFNNHNYEDLTGQRFGMLKVIKQIPGTNKNRGALWNCKCDCGKEIPLYSLQLRNGKRSCGCTDNSLYCLFKHVAVMQRIKFLSACTFTAN